MHVDEKNNDQRSVNTDLIPGSGGDGLTVYSSVDRTDFTFRSRVFGGFLQGAKRQGFATLRSFEWNEAGDWFQINVVLPCSTILCIQYRRVHNTVVICSCYVVFMFNLSNMGG